MSINVIVSDSYHLRYTYKISDLFCSNSVIEIRKEIVTGFLEIVLKISRNLLLVSSLKLYIELRNVNNL